TPYVGAAEGVEDEGLWLLTRSPQVIEFNDQPPGDDPDAPSLGAAAAADRTPTQVLTLPRNVVPVAPLEVVFVPPEVITIRDDAYDTTRLRRAA
ncbi:hypothetical protein SJ263_23725, partial [Enterobacter hormaechei]|uniref:hypothetical protein n=1 Tax=Enterobacter hormaechei TaxID=158836 RepID=UPI0029DAC84A